MAVQHAAKKEQQCSLFGGYSTLGWPDCGPQLCWCINCMSLGCSIGMATLPWCRDSCTRSRRRQSSRCSRGPRGPWSSSVFCCSSASRGVRSMQTRSGSHQAFSLQEGCFLGGGYRHPQPVQGHRIEAAAAHHQYFWRMLWWTIRSNIRIGTFYKVQHVKTQKMMMVTLKSKR